jgi:hypothetical protein
MECLVNKMPPPKRRKMLMPILERFQLDPLVDGEIETDRADLIELLKATPGFRYSEVEVEKFQASPEATKPLPPLVEPTPDFDVMTKDAMVTWAVQQDPPIAIDHRETNETIRKKVRHELKKREKAEAGK